MKLEIEYTDHGELRCPKFDNCTDIVICRDWEYFSVVLVAFVTYNAMLPYILKVVYDNIRRISIEGDTSNISPQTMEYLNDKMN